MLQLNMLSSLLWIGLLVIAPDPLSQNKSNPFFFHQIFKYSSESNGMKCGSNSKIYSTSAEDGVMACLFEDLKHFTSKSKIITGNDFHVISTTIPITTTISN